MGRWRLLGKAEGGYPDFQPRSEQSNAGRTGNPNFIFGSKSTRLPLN